jgi:hypothetical protein
MLILTAEGTRSIDDALVLCMDGYRADDEHSYVTVYLLTGEQVSGIVAKTALDDLDPPPMAI